MEHDKVPSNRQAVSPQGIHEIVAGDVAAAEHAARLGVDRRTPVQDSPVVQDQHAEVQTVQGRERAGDVWLTLGAQERQRLLVFIRSLLMIPWTPKRSSASAWDSERGCLRERERVGPPRASQSLNACRIECDSAFELGRSAPVPYSPVVQNEDAGYKQHRKERFLVVIRSFVVISVDFQEIVSRDQKENICT